MVEALQGFILVGLIVATGEAISRDLLPNVTTFSRVAPSQRGWIGAWVQASRWALPAASIVLAYEAAMSVFFDPGGLTGRALPIIAGALSSPVQSLTMAALVGKDVLWNEGLFRLWLFPLLIFWARGPLIADQYSFALQCGFDAVLLDEAVFARQDAPSWDRQAQALSLAYQSAQLAGQGDFGRPKSILALRQAARFSAAAE